MALARVLYQQPDLIPPTNRFPRSIRRSPISPPPAQRGGARARVTLVANLHAIDLAVRYFPRVVGVWAGRIAFDCEAGAVSDGMLADLLTRPPRGDGNGGIEPGRPL